MLTEADLYKKCDIQETESQQSAESNATSTVKFSSPPAAPLLRSRRIGSIRRRSPAAADQDSSRALRKAVSIACPDIQVLSLRSLSAEATIMAGMEKELLRFDEMAVSCRQCENVSTIILLIAKTDTQELQVWSFGCTRFAENRGGMVLKHGHV